MYVRRDLFAGEVWEENYFIFNSIYMLLINFFDVLNI